jgi:hypothetical protein
MVEGLHIANLNVGDHRYQVPLTISISDTGGLSINPEPGDRALVQRGNRIIGVVGVDPNTYQDQLVEYVKRIEQQLDVEATLWKAKVSLRERIARLGGFAEGKHIVMRGLIDITETPYAEISYADGYYLMSYLGSTLTALPEGGVASLGKIVVGRQNPTEIHRPFVRHFRFFLMEDDTIMACKVDTVTGRSDFDNPLLDEKRRAALRLLDTGLAAWRCVSPEGSFRLFAKTNPPESEIWELTGYVPPDHFLGREILDELDLYRTLIRASVFNYSEIWANYVRGSAEIVGLDTEYATIEYSGLVPKDSSIEDIPFLLR